MNASLILPCYNEEDSLTELIAWSQNLASSELEIVFIDNGSTDKTYEIMKENISGSPDIKIVQVKKNRGYGYGIIQGLKQSRGDVLAWTHADLQTDPADVLRGLRYFENTVHAEDTFVKGYRVGRTVIDKIFALGMSTFESIVLFTTMSEINAQPTIFHRSFFETWQDPPLDYSLDLYVYYNAKIQHLKIVRFPVVFRDRKYGSSHWNFNQLARLRFILDLMKYSLQMKKSVK